MIAGAIFAGTGRAGLNVVVVGVVAFVASVAGAEIGYLIGRFAGRELVLRYGRYVMIKPHHLDRAEAIVDRYGGVVVVIARYIVGLREANGIIAGITEMRWLTFTVFNVIGGCAWVATWVTIGDVAGDHIDTIYADINRYSLYVFGALVVLLAGYIAWRVVRRRRHGRAAAGGDRGEPAGQGELQGSGLVALQGGQFARGCPPRGGVRDPEAALGQRRVRGHRGGRAECRAGCGEHIGEVLPVQAQDGRTALGHEARRAGAGASQPGPFGMKSPPTGRTGPGRPRSRPSPRTRPRTGVRYRCSAARAS